MKKFIQIACSDSPASDGVRAGGPILYALDEAGDIWTLEKRVDGDPIRGYTSYVREWVKIPRQELPTPTKTESAARDLSWYMVHEGGPHAAKLPEYVKEFPTSWPLELDGVQIRYVRMDQYEQEIAARNRMASALAQVVETYDESDSFDIKHGKSLRQAIEIARNLSQDGYLKSEISDEELARLRREAIEEVADAFGFNWLCLDHGGEEVLKIREMIYAVRDRKTVSHESEKQHVCASCNGLRNVCDASISQMEAAYKEGLGFIPGCVSPEHPGFRPCPECSNLPRKDEKHSV